MCDTFYYYESGCLCFIKRLTLFKYIIKYKKCKQPTSCVAYSVSDPLVSQYSFLNQSENAMSPCAEKMYDHLLSWGYPFTLDELRYVFGIQNEPVFQSAVAELISSKLVKTLSIRDKIGLIRA